MQAQDIPRGRDLSPEVKDRKIESAVLAFVLEQHPAQLSTGEVVLAFERDRAAFCQVDAIERALAELVGAGLLRRVGPVLAPTLPALYYSRLGVVE